MKYKNGILSAVFGILQQLLTLTFGLIVPRLFIRTFGSEMTGMLGTLGSLYSYLALVEAGVGTASIQALWGPLGRNDKRGVNEIMVALSQWYNKAGMIYFSGVVLISVVYPLTIKTSIPFWTIFSVSMLSGMGGVINYWVQGKYIVLMRAEGKKYIMSLVTMANYVASNIIKIVMLLNGFDVVAIHVGYFCLSLCQGPAPAPGRCGLRWQAEAGGLVNLDPRVPGWGLRAVEQGSVAVGHCSLWAELWTARCLGLGAGLGCRVDGEGPTPGSSFLLHFLFCCFQWK